MVEDFPKKHKNYAWEAFNCLWTSKETEKLSKYDKNIHKYDFRLKLVALTLNLRMRFALNNNSSKCANSWNKAL